MLALALAHPAVPTVLSALTSAIRALFSAGEPGAVFMTTKPNDVYRRRNLLTYTEALSNAATGKTDTTAADNALAVQDGGQNIWLSLLTEGSAGNALTNTPSTLNLVAGMKVSRSTYFKRGNHDWVRVMVCDTTGGAAGFRAWVNLATGQVGTANTFGAGADATSATVRDVGDGVYRLTLSCIPKWGGAIASMVLSASDDGSFTRVANGTRYQGGEQFERGEVSEYQRVTDWTTEFLYAGVDYTRRNVLSYSEQFDNAVWVKAGSSAVLASVAPPQGAAKVYKLVEDGANALHRMRQAVGSAGTYAPSIRAKAGERTQLWMNGSDAAGGPVFDLLSGTVSGGSGAIKAVGDGWYECSFTGALTTNGPYIGTYNGSQTYQGDGVSGVYIAAAQADVGSVVTTYQPVTDGSEFIPQVNPALTMFTDHQGVTPLTALEQTMGLQLDVRPIFLGPNLVTNSRFGDTASWTAQGAATLAAVAGEMEVTATGAAFPGANQTIQTVAGRTYQLSGKCHVGAGTTTSARVAISGIPASEFSNNGTAIPAEVSRKEFTATASSHLLTLYMAVGTSGFKAYFDDVEVREVIAAPNAVGTPLRGPELVSNPGPFTATTGFTFKDASGGASTPSMGSVANGVLTVTGAGTPRAAFQVAGLVVGQSYELLVQFVGTATSSPFATIAPADDLTSAVVSEPSSSNAARLVRLQWIANATTMWVGVRSGAAGSFSIGSLRFRLIYGNHRTQATSGARSKVTARYNKVTAVNANPTSTAGLTLTNATNGLTTLTLESDTAALAAAGLDRTCTLGNVFKLDNSAGDTYAYASVSGTTGNTNDHVVSAWVRGSGTGEVRTDLTAPTTRAIALTSAYQQKIVSQATLSAGVKGAADKLRISAAPGAVVYFILPDMREACYSYLPTPQVVWDSTTGYDDEGFPARIQRLGTHGEATAVIPFSSCQQAQMFWASGKMSDAVTGIVIECGTAANFTLNAPRSAGVGNYGTDLRGGGNTATSQSPSSYPASHAAVVVGLVDTTQATIAGQTRTLVNGAESVATSGTLVPVGTYFTDETVSFGCRGAGGVISAGSTTDEFASIVRGGATPDAATITAVTRALADVMRMPI